MTKLYLASDAIGLHDGSVTEIVIAMRWPRYVSIHNPANAEPCPYQPGDRIGVKEKWRVAALHSKSGWYIQYADGSYAYVAHSEPSYKPAGEWCPASKMRLAWVRTNLACLSTDCREIDGRWQWVVQVRKEQGT